MAAKPQTPPVLTLARKTQINLHELIVEICRMNELESRVKKALTGYTVTTDQFIVLRPTPELLSLLPPKETQGGS